MSKKSTLKGTHQYHPVIKVCLLDFEQEYNDQVAEDILEMEEAENNVNLARDLSEEEWSLLTERMADILYDGDKWAYAMEAGLDEVRQWRREKAA